MLRRELLIPVTRFFRDADVFEHLADQVVAPLVGREAAMEPIRVWVACCATGEEAYSIAILFAEAFQRLGRMRPVKIFATDVEQHYLDHAAAGHYPDTIAAEVSGQRLERWFMERDGGWTVRPEIRQMVIFARHNLVADPPFTRMDLVTCRNALIYFQPGAQERAMRRLQYALQPGGHLLLGPSESLGVLHRDFAALPGRGKIYRLLRRDRLGLQLDSNSRHETSSQRRATRRRPPEVAPPSAQAWVTQGERQLQQAYLPPSLAGGALARTAARVRQCERAAADQRRPDDAGRAEAAAARAVLGRGPAAASGGQRRPPRELRASAPGPGREVRARCAWWRAA